VDLRLVEPLLGAQTDGQPAQRRDERQRQVAGEPDLLGRGHGPAMDHLRFREAPEAVEHGPEGVAEGGHRLGRGIGAHLDALPGLPGRDLGVRVPLLPTAFEGGGMSTLGLGERSVEPRLRHGPLHPPMVGIPALHRHE
jgi:hypothetical protein